MVKPVPVVLQQLLAREVVRGERVVWQGRPTLLGRARSSFRTFLFGIPFLAFALFWTWGASGGFGNSKSGFGWFAYLWGGMFVVAGAAMLFSPLWAVWVGRRTLYAVTDRRAILIEVPLRRATVQSFSGATLEGVVRREASGGGGDLIFEREAAKGSKGRTVYRDVGFLGLEDALTVQRLLPTQLNASAEPRRRTSGAHDA